LEIKWESMWVVQKSLLVNLTKFLMMKNGLNIFEQVGLFAYCSVSKNHSERYHRAIILLFFLTMISLFVLSLAIKIRMDTQVDFVSWVVMLVIVFGSNYLCNYYFTKSARCLKIIQAYEKLTARKRYWYGAIAPWYLLFSILFIFLELAILAYSSDRY
jgi:hypothetical protein